MCLSDLPQSLLLRILLTSCSGEVHRFCSLSAVCSAWAGLLRRGPFLQLRSLTVLAPGGCCPFAFVERWAPALEELSLSAESGVTSAEELAPLHSTKLSRLSLQGVALPAEALLSLASPSLVSLDVSQSSFNAATLSAVLRRCPLLTALVADGAAFAPKHRDGGPLLVQALADHRSLTHLSLRGAGQVLNTARLAALAWKLTGLELLDISGTAVTDIPLPVALLPRLAVLRADDCELQNTSFTALYVEAAPVRQAGVSALRHLTS